MTDRCPTCRQPLRRVITAEMIAESERRTCGICAMAPGQPCRNIGETVALPGRAVHYERLGPL